PYTTLFRSASLLFRDDCLLAFENGGIGSAARPPPCLLNQTKVRGHVHRHPAQHPGQTPSQLLTVQLGQESTQEQTSLLVGGTSGIGVPARGQFGEFAQKVVTGGGGHQRRFTFLVHRASVQVGDGYRAAVVGD